MSGCSACDILLSVKHINIPSAILVLVYHVQLDVYVQYAGNLLVCDMRKFER